MRNRSTSLLIGLVCVALTSGCTTTSRGEPGPATTGPSQTATVDPTRPSGEPGDELPTDGAPAVPNPLDTTAFQKDPCRVLTPSQSQELNVGSAGTPYDAALGNGCEWANAETRGRTILSFLDRDPRGLSALYRANKAHKYAYFEEIAAIEGFPAVVRDIVDDREDGYCTAVVGVSDEIAFETFLQLSLANKGKKDACAVAAQVAGMALRTMKLGG